MTPVSDFSYSIEVLQEGHVVRYKVLGDGARLDYAAVIEQWRNSRIFRSFFVELLATAAFDTYRWETPAVNKQTASQPFEFVLVNHPGLAAHADRFAFREHFATAEDEKNAGIVVFKNLGRDATLITPSPRSKTDAFNHLAQFTRTATEEQNEALWKTIGKTMAERLNNTPVWLNTAGDGVSWLHIRLDNQPKYYHYSPYARIAR